MMGSFKALTGIRESEAKKTYIMRGGQSRALGYSWKLMENEKNMRQSLFTYRVEYCDIFSVSESVYHLS